MAAYQGHKPIVQFLLSKGARPNAVDDDGDSVLHDAAFGNQPEVKKNPNDLMMFSSVLFE